MPVASLSLICMNGLCNELIVEGMKFHGLFDVGVYATKSMKCAEGYMRRHCFLEPSCEVRACLHITGSGKYKRYDRGGKSKHNQYLLDASEIFVTRIELLIDKPDKKRTHCL